ASAWFQAFLAGTPGYEDFYVRLDPDVDTSAVVRPRTSPLTHPFTTPDGRAEHVWTTFSADQVDLDYRNPAVVQAMTDVLLAYVRHGAGAIRLDAVAYVGKDPATPSIHLPAAHALVRHFRAALDAIAPDVLLVTETNVPHAENVSYFGGDGAREA